MTQERKKLVELKNVSLTFNKGKSNEVKAIDDVSFDIYEGEIFGLVGESGSGKTTIGRSILKLYDIDSGTVTFAGNDISSLKGKDLHDFRKTAQMNINPLSNNITNLHSSIKTSLRILKNHLSCLTEIMKIFSF